MSESTTVTDLRPGPRSPFSKISSALGLAQKPRWISDFRIELDHKNPNHFYNPNDVIRGTIFFTPRKVVKITHITISLYGYVHVFKSYNGPGETVSKDSIQSDPSKLLGVPGIVPLFTPVEETLFGDVKLEPCRGQFQFALRLPNHRLPSSIDFERGSIQYNLVATITRPHLTNPVIRSDPKKFMVHENIDCGRIPIPKPRLVSIEALEKKKKRRKKTPSLTISAEKFGTIATVAEEQEPPSPSRSSIAPSTDGSHHSNEGTSMSTSSSSVELRITHITSNNPISPVGQNSSQNGSQNGSLNGSQKATPKPVVPSKTITASAEIGRGAFLPGDSIPVRVQVAHIKHIKSMCGLIVTLYRKTHIETEPLIHQQVRDENGNITLKPVTQDVYPKSFSGFGGLSINNKQTSHTFRMDVAQTHVPLFIDPVTHKADIKTRLEIPTEGVHPTITHVRGDTLDFRYYVEICLDVQGKLEESRLLPRLTNQAVHGLGKPSARKSPSVPMSTASQGQQMIDTQTIKRERPSMVHWTFHVVIGTKDSSRGIRSASKTNVQQQAPDPWQNIDTRMQKQNSMQGSDCSRGSKLGDVQEDRVQEEARDVSSRGTGVSSNGVRRRSPLHQDTSPPLDETRWDRTTHSGHESTRHYTHPPPALPPLVIPDEPMNEKARLKQQEQRLLPSQPDFDEAEGSSPMPYSAPSAPPVEQLEEQYVVDLTSNYSGTLPGPSNRQQLYRSQTHDGSAQTAYTPLAMYRHASSSHLDNARPSGTSTPPVVSSGGFSGFDFTPVGGSRIPPATDDKEELERRRLHAQSSVPDYEELEQDAEATQPNVPTVPSEDDHHAAFGEWSTSQEGLPRYENLDR